MMNQLEFLIKLYKVNFFYYINLISGGPTKSGWDLTTVLGACLAVWFLLLFK
jgi:hypothetical protein